MPKIPEEYLKILRQRRSLEEDDDSQDKDILRMSPLEMLREVAAWYIGSATWADEFITWAEDLGVIKQSTKEKEGYEYGKGNG